MANLYWGLSKNGPSSYDEILKNSISEIQKDIAGSKSSNRWSDKYRSVNLGVEIEIGRVFPDDVDASVFELSPKRQ